MHAPSYACSAAVAVGASYRQWAEWIWQGNVAAVIAMALTLEQQRLGPPPEGARPGRDDPRGYIDRKR